jgi:endonuclease/exonuclease/phosphatase family metal-dependent hydrolase
MIRLLMLAAALFISAAPAPAATDTANFRIASFNVKGGHDNASWKERRDGVVSTIVKSEANVVLLQEARYPKQILSRLNKKSPRTWSLVKGKDAVHILTDGTMQRMSVYRMGIGYDREYVEARLRHRKTGVRFRVWATHLIASNESQGRPTEVAAQMRKEQARKIAPRITQFQKIVGGGDINSHYTHEGSLASLFIHDEVRDRVPLVENGHLNSVDNFKPNPENGEWLDRLFTGPQTTVRAVGLIDSKTFSDHNLIWADMEISQ